VLADWWTRPDPNRIALWRAAGYQDEVKSLWEDVLACSSDAVTSLLTSLSLEQNFLTAEYERLFVGPAAIPCPPYESVWRTDRPKNEQGTVIGRSTLRVQQLYREMGLQLRPEQVEIPDHLAIELEALAFALAIGDRERSDQLLKKLREWLPPFCSSVIDSSLLLFYRGVAEITRECISSEWI
jgi:TorA maturation chaperone TorD